jgi:uracil phosphoribosyltransferase
MLKVLSEEASIVGQYLHELRDVDLQKDRHRFEENIERIGAIAGYEASKLLGYDKHKTTTPLGIADTMVLKDGIILNTILRAGMPLQRGVHSMLPMAELSFIAAGRKPETSAGVEIELSYVATPRLENKVLIIADTMIATGKSLVDGYNALIKHYGMPTRTIIIGVIASRDGITYVTENIPRVDIITAVVDDTLDSKFYIVPGLGDAGDLLYGPKALSSNNTN